MDVGTRTCPNCAAPLAEGSVFCHVCGTRTPTGAYTALAPDGNETRRRLIAAVGRDYELRGMLGAGGFAEVYLAWDRKLKREVAIKTLRSELSAAAGVGERFRREAEAIAQLRHPHIVPIYSVAESEGVAWFVMPKVQGVTLAKALETDSRWSFAEVCRILREAAGALAAAHAAGIVHRDIKPENIMLEGPERRVVLMDFGIAKSVGDATSTLTGTGMMIGTPQYMSPEQASGDSTIGPHSDQYSLGLVGYRLLTGRAAFQADSMRTLMVMQASMAPPPVRDVRPDTPIALARAIERTLAKDPAARFVSMQSLSDDLDRVARDVAGEYRRGRRTVPIADRWTEALRRTHEIRRPAIIAVIVGLVLTVATFRYTVSAAVHDVLRTRQDALFAARAIMSANGVRAFPEWSGFMQERRLYEFLQKAVGPDSADRLARDVYHVWAWEFDFSRSDPRGNRWLYFAKDAQLVRNLLFLRDSLRVGTMTAAAARPIADSVLRSHGEDPARLTFDRVESSSFPKYTTHAFTWFRPEHVITRGHDTARVGVTVGITGSIPSGFNRRGDLRGPPEPPEGTLGLVVFSTAFPVLLIALALGGIAFVVRRGAIDVMQWAMALRITLPLLVIWFIVMTLASEVDELRMSSLSDNVIRQLPPELSVWLLATVCLVAAESLWYESRPHLTAGLEDLARGNPRVPEIVPAALSGYAWGLALLGLGSALVAAGHRLFEMPYSTVPVALAAYQNRLPGMAPLLAVSFALAFCSVILFLGGVLQRKRGLLPVLCLVTGLVGGTAFGLAFNSVEAAAFTMMVMLIPVCVMRNGFIAGVIALSVALGAPIAIDLLWTGGPYLWSGIAGLLLLLLPALWALRVFALRPIR